MKNKDKENSDAKTPSADKIEDKRKRHHNVWPLWVFFISLVLSFIFNLISELVLDDTQVTFAFVLTFLIMALGIVFDVIGTAATSCDVEPLLSMASRKVKGAKRAVALVRNAEKVASVCCDIIGDICGIISGVCGASIVIGLAIGENLFLSILVLALISTLTISGKAVGKNYAVNNSTQIILGVGKVFSVFDK